MVAACCLSSLSVNTNAYTRPCRPSAFPGLQGVCCICLSAGLPEGVWPSKWFETGRSLTINHLAIEGPVEVDGRCLALACVVTTRPLSECFSQLIPNMPRQIYSSVIKRRKQSFGCLSDLKPTTIDEDKQGWLVEEAPWLFS